MLYTELKINDNELKLRIDARACVALEKKLGKSPLDVFMTVQGNTLPQLTDLIYIFHAALQKYQHNMTEEKAFDLYDQFIEAGYTLTDFIPIIIDVLKVSGFFNEDNESEKK